MDKFSVAITEGCAERRRPTLSRDAMSWHGAATPSYDPQTTGMTRLVLPVDVQHLAGVASLDLPLVTGKLGVRDGYKPGVGCYPKRRLERRPPES